MTLDEIESITSYAFLIELKDSDGEYIMRFMRNDRGSYVIVHSSEEKIIIKLVDITNGTPRKDICYLHTDSGNRIPNRIIDLDYDISAGEVHSYLEGFRKYFDYFNIIEEVIM